MATTLITGLADQDGSYLAEHLLGLGYETLVEVMVDSEVSALRAGRATPALGRRDG